MFGNFSEQLYYMSRLRKLKETLKTTDSLDQKSCNCCSYCCWQKPCNLNKEDIKIMSDYFKTTPKLLFKKYLVVDDAGVEGGKFTLTPIRKQQKEYAGSYLPSKATFDIDTPCVFLNEDSKKCTLHGLAKPEGGRTMNCWEELQGNIYGFTKEELMELVGWDGDEDEWYDEF